MIKIAKHAGFCKGVKRAIDAAIEVGKEEGNAVTLGPIVHNQFVVNHLSNYGVGTIETQDELTGLNKDTTVVLRSHGVAKSVYDTLDASDIKYIDATCPFVKAVHKLANNAYKDGKNVIIVGDPKHPEVIGIMGWTDNQGYVVNTAADVKKLPKLEGPIVIVAQTTQTFENWETITNMIKEEYDEVKINNTICMATSERQSAAIELAQDVDIMLVVGSSSSSNTRKLTEVCNNEGVLTYQIESKNDIDRNWFNTNKKNVGITAGASTPDWILKEVIEMVEEIQNENLNEEEKEETGTEGLMADIEVANIKEGDIVRATVTHVEDTQVRADIGYKFEGLIPIKEISNLFIESAIGYVNAGDSFDAEVLKIDDNKGLVLLSKKNVDKAQALDSISKKFESGETFDVIIADVVKGGLVVDLGIRAFIPASHVESFFVDDFTEYKGKAMTVKVIKFEPENNEVVLSHKVVAEEKLALQKADALAALEVGKVVEGLVQRLTDFGAFVDLNGIDGLVHVSEISWDRVDKPSDILKEGDKIKVKILAIDTEKERISLSIKATQASPWDSFVKKHRIGDKIQGKIKRLVNFGAFVELEPGIEGLVHVSEISHEHVASPTDVLKVDQDVEVKILDISSSDKRISLSIRATTDAPVTKIEADYVEVTPNEESTYTLEEMFGDKLKKLL